MNKTLDERATEILEVFAQQGTQGSAEWVGAEMAQIIFEQQWLIRDMQIDLSASDRVIDLLIEGIS